MKNIYVMGLSLSLVLTGCDSAAKFDGTSQESLLHSTQKVRNSLTVEKKEQLRLAINDIMDYYDTEARIKNDNNYSSENTRLLVLNGKTADQVISDARSFRGRKVKLLLLYQQEK